MIALKDSELFRQQALIGGNWRDASAKATVNVIDPASQEVLGTIPDMGRDETKAAIDAAADALEDKDPCGACSAFGALVRTHASP
jgi:succinate-semialdehyde dehydrogenase/glutarate-semialdehyde dehydrogenase